MTDRRRVILLGDVGGTKTLLVRGTHGSDGFTEDARRVYSSAEFADLDAILSDFLAQVPGEVEHAVLAVAGPVRQDRATLTNLPWVVEARVIEDRFGMRHVTLLNDVEALAHAIPRLGHEELLTLNAGDPDLCGAVALAAVGTGLGQAYLVWNGASPEAHPSEGSHADFAPTTDEHMRLLRFLRQAQDHVSVEHVCSGLGMQNLYRFLETESQAGDAVAVREEVLRAEDPTRVIVTHALSGESQLCMSTVALFVEILGAELGNLALKVLATGGVYVGGGLALRVLPFLKQGLLPAFVRKGSFERLLTRVPVHVIMSSDGVVQGAAHCAVRRWRGEDSP